MASSLVSNPNRFWMVRCYVDASEGILELAHRSRLVESRAMVQWDQWLLLGRARLLPRAVVAR
jgi:hypothetical protein